MGLWKRIAETRVSGKIFGKSYEGPFDINIEELGKTQRFERSRDLQAMEDFNNQVKAWGDKTRAALAPSIQGQGIKGAKLLRSLKSNYKYDYGEIFRIGFSFAREGVFVHKGVGRGYVMRNGVVVKISKTQGFNRNPKPWFNPVINAHLPELGDIIVNYTKTAIINSSRIYIR